MRRISELWPPQVRRKRPRTVYVGSHEDELSRLAGMRIDPDDDGRTREDVERQKAASRGAEELATYLSEIEFALGAERPRGALPAEKRFEWYTRSMALLGQIQEVPGPSDR